VARDEGRGDALRLDGKFLRDAGREARQGEEVGSWRLERVERSSDTSTLYPPTSNL
jgi:hypothetical protein